LVVFHGFLDQGPAWHAVAAPLAERLGGPVWALDHRGHGCSDPASETSAYPFWDYVADADAWMSDLPGPVDVLGHSMGGTVACLLASVLPERVRRLVLVEGLGPPDLSGARRAIARQALEQRRRPAEPTRVDSLQAAADKLRRASPNLPEDLARLLAARATVEDADGRRFRFDPRHRSRSVPAFEAAPFLDYLSQVRAPTLTLKGTHSPVQLPDEAARLAALRPAAQRALPGGHNLHHDAPAAVVDAVLTFLTAEDPWTQP
jgi:pimeloyl-ACP methyl ester carboxylesterase